MCSFVCIVNEFGINFEFGSFLDGIAVAVLVSVVVVVSVVAVVDVFRLSLIAALHLFILSYALFNRSQYKIYSNRLITFISSFGIICLFVVLHLDSIEVACHVIANPMVVLELNKLYQDCTTTTHPQRLPGSTTKSELYVCGLLS